MNNVLHNNLINGVMSDYLNVNDRSIHYGDGLFETILCHNNKLYYWSQHFLRLQTSAEKLKIACPQEQVLLEDIAKLLKKKSEKNKSKDESACAIKIILSRGAGERGYKFSKEISANRFVSLSGLAIEYSSLLSKKLYSGKLFLCEQQVSINKNLAGLKHLNRLENVLARNEWHSDHIDGLMLDANQHVIEGTMSNLFAIKDNRLFTPDLGLSGVRGIMRDAIMRSAHKNNIETVVSTITLDALYDMDECFISNSLIGMKSVTNLGEATYNTQGVTNVIFKDLLVTMKEYVQVV